MHSMRWRGEEPSPSGEGLLVRWSHLSNELERVRGRANIRPGHLYIVLVTAHRRGGMISRYLLMREASLTEASSRTLMKKMVAMGLFQPYKGGHLLTRYGRRAAEYLQERIAELGIASVPRGIKGYGWAAYMCTEFHREMLIRLRDSVIRHGGDAALILEKTGDKIVFPESGEELERYHPDLYRELREAEPYGRARFIIISYSSERTMARLSSLDSGLEYLEALGL